MGVMPLFQAREVAKKQNLDLVEVAATATPPVCRLLDYGKYKYEQAKKEREARRSQRTSLLRIAKKLLANGDKVRVSVMFRGREITHPEIGWRLLQRMSETLKEVASVERQPLLEGRNMFIILSAPQKAKTQEEVKS